MITLEGPQCIVDKSSKEILADTRPPLHANASIFGIFGPPTPPLVAELYMISLIVILISLVINHIAIGQNLMELALIFSLFGENPGP